MTNEEQHEAEESKVQNKTLIVLGLTFVLPILATLIAVYILL